MNDLKNWMQRKGIFHMLFLCIILSACEKEIGRKVQSTGIYYDVAGFLDQQVPLLDSLGPGVEKVVEADGIKEEQRIALDSVGWAKELEMFYRADINDPILRDAYEKTQSEEGTHKIVTYKAKESSVKVHWLQITYRNNAVTHIAARIQEDNVLYKAKSLIELDFDDQHEPPLLMRYSIQQSQKILFKDTVFYSVEGRLNW